MRHSHPATVREQVAVLRRQFLQDGDLPFTDVLTEGVIAPALAALTGWLDRIYSPVVTLWVFLGQVLSADHSCRAAVARLIAHRLGRGHRIVADVSVEGFRVFAEQAGPAAVVPFSDGVEPAGSEFGDASLNGGEGESGDVLLGEAVVGEAEDFHSPLDLRTRVEEAVVVDLLSLFGTELDESHGILPRKCVKPDYYLNPGKT